MVEVPDANGIVTRTGKKGAVRHDRVADCVWVHLHSPDARRVVQERVRLSNLHITLATVSTPPMYKGKEKTIHISKQYNIP